MTALVDRLRLLSLREFARHRGRTAASMTVVAVSAAFLVAVLGISGSVTASVTRLANGLAGNASLEVSGITDSGFAESLQHDVAGVPGVAAAVPLLRASIPTSSGPVLLLGADAGSAALESDLRSAVTDQLGSLIGTTDGVLVGPGVGYEPGQSFTLGSGRVTVAAVLRGDRLAKLNGGHYILAPLQLAQRLTDRGGQLDSVLIVTAPHANAAKVNSAVVAVVAGRAVVAAPSIRAAQAGSGLQIVEYLSLMGALVAFVVAAFLIYTAMTMTITQRRPVISMLRAIGGRRTTVVGDLLAEAAALGALGGAVGSGLGILLGRIVIDRLPAALMQAVQARTEYSLPAYAIPLAIVAATITSVAASAVAARQVYKVSPIEALAPVGASTADVLAPWLLVTSALGCVVLTVVTVVIAVAHVGMIALLALALLFGAQLALCFALTGPIVSATSALARSFGAPGALAGATIRRAPRRVWATIMTVAIAVSTTIAITGANTNTIDSVRDTLTPLAAADAWVSSSPSDSFPTQLLPRDLTATVAAVPGVARVVEEQYGFATLAGTKVMLCGLAADTDNPLYRAVDEKVRSQLVAGAGIVLSRDLGKALNVGVGDTLELQTPHGVQPTKVLQLVSYFSAITGTVGIARDRMAEWFNRPGATTLQVDAAPRVDKQRLLADLRRVTPAQFSVFDGQAALDGVSAGMRQGTSVANAIWIIVVLIATVALLNTLMLSVLQRQRELGVLRAMGSSRRFALRTVLAEAAGIGIVGGVIGVVCGLLSQYLNDVIAPDIMNVDVVFRPTRMTVVFATGALMLTLLGSIPPAVRAARLNIIDAVSAE